MHGGIYHTTCCPPGLNSAVECFVNPTKILKFITNCSTNLRQVAYFPVTGMSTAWYGILVLQSLHSWKQISSFRKKVDWHEYVLKRYAEGLLDDNKGYYVYHPVEYFSVRQGCWRHRIYADWVSYTIFSNSCFLTFVTINDKDLDLHCIR